jgi:hypothetical protein
MRPAAWPHHKIWKARNIQGGQGRRRAGGAGRRKVAPRAGCGAQQKSRGRTFAKPTSIYYGKNEYPPRFQTQVSHEEVFHADCLTKLSSPSKKKQMY